MRVLALAATFAAAVSLVSIGCTTNPITGRAQLSIISSDVLESASMQSYARLLEKPRAERRVNSDAPMVARVRGIADRLILVAGRHYPHSRGWPWEVSVVESSVMNAGCLPRGRIVVTTGIVNQLALTDDEIAVLLGHEIGHAVAEHAAEKISLQLVVNAGLQALVRQNRYARAAPELTVEVSKLLVTLPYGRTQESESDHIGLVLAHEAGFDIERGWSLFEKMNQASTSRTPEFLSSHPSHDTRIAEMRALVPTVQARSRSTQFAGKTIGLVAAAPSATSTPASSLTESRYRGIQLPDFSVAPKVKPKEGRWDFQAHQVVKKQQQCFLDRLELVEARDGVEKYVVGCHDKSVHDVACDSFGTCEALPKS